MGTDTVSAFVIKLLVLCSNLLTMCTVYNVQRCVLRLNHLARKIVVYKGVAYTKCQYVIVLHSVRIFKFILLDTVTQRLRYGLHCIQKNFRTLYFK
jgi:hypothetical protein